jgi:hypothetical protein
MPPTSKEISKEISKEKSEEKIQEKHPTKIGGKIETRLLAAPAHFWPFLDALRNPNTV